MVKKGFFVLIILVNILVSFTYVNGTVSNNLNEVKETYSVSEKFPNINARHSVILDRNSKTILYGKKEKETCKMASTTKIMTAIVVIENSNLNDIVTISAQSAKTGGSRLGLSTGDTITVENLLYGLMMRSRK